MKFEYVLHNGHKFFHKKLNTYEIAPFIYLLPTEQIHTLLKCELKKFVLFKVSHIFENFGVFV